MTLLAQSNQTEWDPSQFKLQPDGSFKISIRAMAAMAGIDDGGLSRSLKSAADENPLPCARSLLAQGFDPADVSSWGETGGIPEDAAPYILEHYGITASSPSVQARAFLLSFSRCGINAYLKERLGLLNQAPQPQAPALPSSFTQGLEAAKMLCDLVGYAGGDKKISMARSLTVIGRDHPDQRKMCFEQQRLLCPETTEFVNVSVLLDALVNDTSREAVDKLVADAKAVGLIKKKDPRALVNQILVRMEFQKKGSGYRNSASWIATEKGQEFSREETRPAQYVEKAWVPQLLWEKSSTLKAIVEWLSKNYTVSA